jgi:hypothetical protein
MEHIAAPAAPIYVVRSVIEIHAPPEIVWRQGVAFTEIPPPEEWMFRAGIAYPLRAKILGNGPGAERHCVFSTGAWRLCQMPSFIKFIYGSLDTFGMKQSVRKYERSHIGLSQFDDSSRVESIR